MTKAEPAKTARNIITITSNVIMKIMTLKKQNKMISAITDDTSIDNKNDNEPTLVLYSVDNTILYLLLFVDREISSFCIIYIISLFKKIALYTVLIYLPRWYLF